MFNKNESIRIILKDFGEVCFYFSLSLFLPPLVSVIYEESLTNVYPFLIAGMIGVAVGYSLKKIFDTKKESKLIHAFLTVILIWIFLPLIGAMPFSLNPQLHLPWLDSYFESVSALTTTGLTMIQTQALPHSLIFWRAFEGWIGGAGIVVLALIGITGYLKASKLMKAEGREERLRPNIINSIRVTWWVYSIITIIGIMLLMINGLSLFDSLNLSMSAISTTGVENYFGQIEQLNSIGVEIALSIIMILGAIAFAVHYKFIKGDLKAYLKDSQTKVMLVIVLIGTIILLPKFLAIYGSRGLSLDYFHVVSAITAGGFNAVSATKWNNFIKLGLASLMFIGGAAGSTAGGIKIIRFWILMKSIWWKIKEKTLPENAYFAKKIDGKEVSDEEISSTYFFIILYIIFILLGTGIILFTNNNYSLSNVLFEVISAQGNAGITSNLTSPNMNAITKLTLIGNMIVGRIEIIPLLFGVGFIIHWKKGGL